MAVTTAGVPQRFKPVTFQIQVRSNTARDNLLGDATESDWQVTTLSRNLLLHLALIPTRLHNVTPKRQQSLQSLQ
jgi:hypothetical protein